MKKTVFIFWFLILGIFTFAQDAKTLALAKQYYQTGDYEKAVKLFEELYKEDASNEYYYTSLLNSYLRLKDYNSAESLVKKQLKKNKDNAYFNLDLANVYLQNNKEKEADAIYNEVINSLAPQESEIQSVANKFIQLQETDYAIKTYVKGRELLKNQNLFTYELGNLTLKITKRKKQFRPTLFQVF
ncbi:MAG: tetratricopeptide repeat protein, partial [Chitinophagales bacterium]|nr:tetratricopeptide repeat protein [Chitinophagales bacterium]